MKLLIIVLCLLSERYLVHAFSLHRTGVFLAYSRLLLPRISHFSYMNNPWILLACLIAPPILICAVLLCVFNGILYGIIGFVLNFAIFYYCLGPKNVFYPDAGHREHDGKALTSKQGVADYFAKVNTQVFSAIFWYILLGPLFLLFYRLINLSQRIDSVGAVADLLTDILEWIPARICAFFYLLVGNFQHGFRYFLKTFVAKPIENHNFLGKVGIYALRTGSDEDDVTMPFAQQLVEHALVVFLVLIALFMMFSWR